MHILACYQLILYDSLPSLTPLTDPELLRLTTAMISCLPRTTLL